MAISNIPNKLNLGQSYHLSWAKGNCVWILKGIGSTGEALLETPKSKKQLTAKAADLRLTNKYVK